MVRGTGYGLGVLVNALARFWLTLMQLLITAMQYIGEAGVEAFCAIGQLACDCRTCPPACATAR